MRVSHCHPRRNKLLWLFTPRLLPHLTMSCKIRVTGWTKSPSLNWDSNPRHSNSDPKQLIHWVHSFKSADMGSNSICDSSLHRPTYLYLNEKREEVRIHEAFNKKLLLLAVKTFQVLWEVTYFKLTTSLLLVEDYFRLPNYVNYLLSKLIKLNNIVFKLKPDRRRWSVQRIAS